MLARGSMLLRLFIPARAVHSAALLSPCLHEKSISRGSLQTPQVHVHSSQVHVHPPRVHLHLTCTRQADRVVPYLLSDIGEGIVEVTVKEWFVQAGDKVSQFDPVCEVQSDKASVTITSRYDGRIHRIHHEVDAVAKVGQPLMDIQLTGQPESESQTGGEQGAALSSLSEAIGVDEGRDEYYRDKALATPAVRRIAKENNVDLSKVSATGKAGRVLKEDIIHYLQDMKKPASLSGVSCDLNGISGGVSSDLSGVSSGLSGVSSDLRGVTNRLSEAYTNGLGSALEDRAIPLTGVRKAMFKTMTDAWKIPHFSYTDEVDVTELLEFRSKVKLEVKAGVKVTYLPFLMKAVSLALAQYPQLNAHMDDTGPLLKIRGEHNIGIAMDTSQGLIVPVVKRVQNLSVIQIARELSRLQLLGSQNKLGMEDLSGGTMTISNIGAIGGIQASPVLLAPQILIGAVTKITRLPGYNEGRQPWAGNSTLKFHNQNEHSIGNGVPLAITHGTNKRLPRYNAAGQLTPRDVVNVSWAADHRAADGATVARFSNLFKLYVAAPRLLMEL